MRSDVFLYLSGPITAKDGFTVEENVSNALRIYLDCLKRGLPAFCPHLSGIFPSAHHDVAYETWLQYDFAVIDRCTHLVLLPRWESSTGAQRERAYAASRDKPILLWRDVETL
jgi:hypothetical protein